MIRTSTYRQQSAFSWWLRTGRLPPAPTPDGIERKFNPWHDPLDGRFTFAGAGRHYGAGGVGPAGSASSRNADPIGRQKPRPPERATRPSAETPPAGQTAQQRKKPVLQATGEVRPKPVGSPRNDQRNPVADFIIGVGEGGYDVAKGTVEGVYAALTTNPVTTLRNVERGIAGMIDTAIAAEDTPARVQVARAASAVANASARDIGRVAGAAAGDVALAVAPGAALARVSELRRLRKARPSPGPFPPPTIGWANENLKSDKPWKAYNDTATGARPGKAPTLMRTLPDGSKRPVKFDGVQGEYMIDRKFAVSGKPRAVAQLLRQSQVLAQHRLIGIWEVPNVTQKNKALKLFKRYNVTNIKVRTVEP